MLNAGASCNKSIRELREAYKVLYRSKINTPQGLQVRGEQFPDSELVQHLSTFIASSERGIIH
jgi:UDP-N-acetylglucosamine acyltransferase